MPENWFERRIATRSISALLLTAAASFAQAQPAPELQQVLDRLDRLETQNRELMTELRALRQQLASVQPAAAAAPAAPIEDRVEVAEQRLSQQDQEKISSDHKLPVTLTGMLLFNSFWNGRGAGGLRRER